MQVWIEYVAVSGIVLSVARYARQRLEGGARMNRFGYLGFLGFLGCLGFLSYLPEADSLAKLYGLFALFSLFALYAVPKRRTDEKDELR